MKIVATTIPDVLILEPDVFADNRGFFFESYNKRTLAEVAGIHAEFVQDNFSRSARNVLRGLHYQKSPKEQGKLVRVLAGEVFDVVVDIRRASPTFGKWVSTLLSAENHRALWVPPGFAHGFLVLSEYADFFYKVTEYYSSDHERGLRWNDPALAIHWPNVLNPILSEKDRNAPFMDGYGE